MCVSLVREKKTEKPPKLYDLTPLQRETLIAFYFQEQTLTQIAADRGVNKSTVCRTLKRAEDKLRRYLKY